MNRAVRLLTLVTLPLACLVLVPALAFAAQPIGPRETAVSTASPLVIPPAPTPAPTGVPAWTVIALVALAVIVGVGGTELVHGLARHRRPSHPATA